MSNTEEKTMISKPKKIWNDALRAVKGENTNQLVEDFTAEMTLVAEGLCEDQNRLRGEVDKMITAEDKRIQKQEARINSLETVVDDNSKENDRIVTELRNRIAALEKKLSSDGKEKKKQRNIIRDLTILIATAAVCAICVILVIRFIK